MVQKKYENTAFKNNRLSLAGRPLSARQMRSQKFPNLVEIS